MRKGIIIGVILVAVVATYAISRQIKSDRPCRKLSLACKAAGFKRGHTAQERRNFYEACMKPLMEKGSLGEISISPEDAVACKQKWGRKQDKANGGGGKKHEDKTPDEDTSDDA